MNPDFEKKTPNLCVSFALKNLSSFNFLLCQTFMIMLIVRTIA
jgi:hypothetical protein